MKNIISFFLTVSLLILLIITSCGKNNPVEPVVNTPTRTATTAGTATSTRTITGTDTITPTFSTTETATETPSPTFTPTITSTHTITPTSTITPDCDFAFGDNVDDDQDYWLGGYLIARPASPSASQTVNALWVKLKYPSAFRAGIYDDNGSGGPGILLAQSEVISGVIGWNYAPIPSYAVTALHQYHLAVVTGSDAMATLGNGPMVKYRTQSWAGVASSGLPSDVTGGTFYNYNSGIKIYSSICY